MAFVRGRVNYSGSSERQVDGKGLESRVEEDGRKEGRGRKKQKRRRVYNEPVEGGKPARSHSSGAGGPRLQLPAFTSGDSAWTSAAQLLLSCSLMDVKSAACNEKSNS